MSQLCFFLFATTFAQGTELKVMTFIVDLLIIFMINIVN